jgi:hypothetical protein
MPNLRLVSGLSMNEPKHLPADLTEQERLIEQLRGVRHVVINARYGGYELSDEAISRYKEQAGIQDPDWSIYDVPRDDNYLVNIVRELGEEADGRLARLKIVEIPADVDWIIQEYDGIEWVAERHRTWS